MSKLINQGGFGCIYYPGIKCNGSTEKKTFISKLQINDYTSFNEVQIGNIIKSIPNYKRFFSPIIDYCKINVSEMDDHLLEKCNTLHNNTNLVLMKLNYIKNDNFYDFLKNKNDFSLYSTLIDKYLFLLHSVELLNNKNIIHFDLKDENILLNSKNKNPIIIDFGISLNMNVFTMDNIEDFFYVYAPEYYLWSFDIHLICFLVKKIEHDTYLFNLEDLKKIAQNYTSNNKALASFSDDFKDDFKNQCIDYGKQFENKTKTYMLKSLIKMENYKTWDNYSLSCMFLKSFKYIFSEGFSNENIFKNIIQILLINLHPDPSKRYTTHETKNKFSSILENSNSSLENMITLSNNIKVNKKEIDIEIKKDNQTIQTISKKSTSRVTLTLT